MKMYKFNDLNFLQLKHYFSEQNEDFINVYRLCHLDILGRNPDRSQKMAEFLTLVERREQNTEELNVFITVIYHFYEGRKILFSSNEQKETYYKFQELYLGDPWYVSLKSKVLQEFPMETEFSMNLEMI